MSTLGAPVANPAKASLSGRSAAWLAPPGRKPAAAVLALTNFTDPETRVRAPTPGMVARLGTLDTRSLSEPVAGAAGGGAAGARAVVDSPRLYRCRWRLRARW